MDATLASGWIAAVGAFAGSVTGGAATIWATRWLWNHERSDRNAERQQDAAVARLIRQADADAAKAIRDQEASDARALRLQAAEDAAALLEDQRAWTLARREDDRLAAAELRSSLKAEAEVDETVTALRGLANSSLSAVLDQDVDVVDAFKQIVVSVSQLKLRHEEPHPGLASGLSDWMQMSPTVLRDGGGKAEQEKLLRVHLTRLHNICTTWSLAKLRFEEEECRFVLDKASSVVTVTHSHRLTNN